MDLGFDISLSSGYENKSQIARVLTESWVEKNIFCPNCGSYLSNYENNKPVADFYCSKCSEDYELKSKKDKMGKKIVDGAYTTMIERLQSESNPNFFFLNYDKNTLDISNFIVIPKHFFIPEIIEKRNPLSSTARRAGWVGCNILLDTIPNSGKIFYVKDSKIQSKDKILEEWHKTSFLKESHNIKSKGWILDILKCIEKLDKKDFTLHDIYKFETYLKLKHPDNNNVQAKIRQQLQVLRDKNYLKFEGLGKYILQ
ncbi:DpnI domain-containing protein [Sulfurimonas sp.]|uniref:DpnI domain-containing protein n=1 Tax=Sulfurimonas sp. TaxID=2022749 RepID=UPI0019FE04BC|nr:DpnI domain-containing protein [Sulfurimonas sp.]MBE0513691.1 restriction endonuclease [Sulfurimonas sp.]